MNKLSDNIAWLDYLIELRARLLYSIMGIVLIFLSLLPFTKQLYHWLALPLMQHLPIDSHIIATAITAPFLTPLKLTFFCALVISLPFCLYQFWMFITPGLYRHEKRYLWSFLCSASLLFLLGLSFCYSLVFPLLFSFLSHAAPFGVIVLPDMSAYLDFALQLLFAFGIAFEVPVIIVLLVKLNLVSTTTLLKQRPYFIIAAFIVGMIVAPDVLSQLALALPLWLLFEIGIWVSGKLG